MIETQCVDCGRELSESAKERGFKRCYDCFMKRKGKVPEKPGPSNWRSEENLSQTSVNLDDKRLAELNMKYGCAYVCRVNGRLFGWGDYSHHPAENINQNLKMLVKILQNNPWLSHAAKDYDSDTYQGKEKVILALLKNQVESIYGENLFELNLLGEIQREAVI